MSAENNGPAPRDSPVSQVDSPVSQMYSPVSQMDIGTPTCGPDEAASKATPESLMDTDSPRHFPSGQLHPVPLYTVNSEPLRQLQISTEQARAFMATSSNGQPSEGRLGDQETSAPTACSPMVTPKRRPFRHKPPSGVGATTEGLRSAGTFASNSGAVTPAHKIVSSGWKGQAASPSMPGCTPPGQGSTWFATGPRSTPRQAGSLTTPRRDGPGSTPGGSSLMVTPEGARPGSTPRHPGSACTPRTPWNPFEKDPQHLLGLTCTPNLFAVQEDPKSPGVFRWSIEQQAIVNPAPIDETPSEALMARVNVDSEAEEEKQRAINKFFASYVIAPSPVEPALKSRNLADTEEFQGRVVNHRDNLMSSNPDSDGSLNQCQLSLSFGDTREPAPEPAAAPATPAGKLSSSPLSSSPVQDDFSVSSDQYRRQSISFPDMVSPNLSPIVKPRQARPLSDQPGSERSARAHSEGHRVTHPMIDDTPCTGRRSSSSSAGSGADCRKKKRRCSLRKSRSVGDKLRSFRGNVHTTDAVRRLARDFDEASRDSMSSWGLTADERRVMTSTTEDSAYGDMPAEPMSQSVPCISQSQPQSSESNSCRDLMDHGSHSNPASQSEWLVADLSFSAAPQCSTQISQPTTSRENSQFGISSLDPSKGLGPSWETLWPSDRDTGYHTELMSTATEDGGLKPTEPRDSAPCSEAAELMDCQATGSGIL